MPVVPLKIERAAPPSPALWGHAAELLDLALTSPKRFERRVRVTEGFLAAHRANAEAMRLRDAEYDEALNASREEYAIWFDRIIPFIRMQTGR